jgi:hypothetical protein
MESGVFRSTESRFFFAGNSTCFQVNQLSASINTELICINEQKNAINQWEKKTKSLCVRAMKRNEYGNERI